jgi:hypothetical protein
MIQKTCCALFAILFSINAFAQQTKTIDLLPTRLDIAGRDFYIDSVVDNRVTKTNIGEAKIGVNNRSVPVVFVQPFDVTLRAWFNLTIPGSNGQTSLIAVINELRVYEKVYKLKERGVADVNITFCKLDSGVLKVVAQTSGTQESGGADVSNGHNDRIDLALRDCLNQLMATDWKENPGKVLTDGGQWTPVDDEHNILKAKAWKYGSYKNFNDLRSNNPENSEQVVVPEAEMGELVLLKVKSTKKKLVEAYAFNDGKAIYINTFFYNGDKSKGVFAKVESIGPYMAWIDYYMSPTTAGVAAGFGLIGAAVASSGDPDIVILDLRTGVISPLRPEILSKILESEPQLLAEYQKGKVRDPRRQLDMIKRFNVLHPDL